MAATEFIRRRTTRSKSSIPSPTVGGITRGECADRVQEPVGRFELRYMTGVGQQLEPGARNR